MRRDMSRAVKQKWTKNAGNKNRPIQSKGEKKELINHKNNDGIQVTPQHNSKRRNYLIINAYLKQSKK